ncbi:imelysin family protein [Shimia sp. MMG029]|uniref:imelysin family protein n=1 Tax=Shimia sp. MMG029 TaxID=3021978 RepID=UPI0022FE55EA|nr:imelysin family protein [Shimia sp. MMG029]MDA5556834.1 imelysin family protein [Shimia sp. MMG029]
MLKSFAFVASFALTAPAFSQEAVRVDQGALVEAAVAQHILPGFEALATTTLALSAAAETECSSTSEPLRAAFHTAFDAWMGVSHLRFGPTEVDERAFGLAFWPDTKGFTPKALGRLIADEDPVIADAAEFQTVSVAGRGFFALEQLLYDPRISTLGAPDYHCALVRRVAADIALSSGAIHTDWVNGFATLLTEPSESGSYETDAESLQVIYKALDSGLQFDAEVRLGRPLGSFDKPRPTRAEARRSGRSLRNVTVSTAALAELAHILSAESDTIRADYSAAFALIQEQATDLQDDPVFAGVKEVQGRFRVEILQQYINRAWDITTLELGPALGVSAGFNALDGD